MTDRSIKKLQIMTMSMGEPFLNYDEVSHAIEDLHELYSGADLLVSTIAPNRIGAFNHFMELSVDIDKIGLQVSIHKSNDEERNKLIPFKDKMSLTDIRDYGIEWYARTGRKVYLNYCVDESNSTSFDSANLQALFSPTAFAFTFSVICSTDEDNAEDADVQQLDNIRTFEETFARKGYDTRIFNPDAQSIGGGCGQLFFVQDWMKKQGRI